MSTKGAPLGIGNVLNLWSTIPDWEKIFEGRVLSNEHLLVWSLCVSLFFWVYCRISYRLIVNKNVRGEKTKDEKIKRLSWMISLLNSVAMTSFGVYYAVKTFHKFPQLRSFDTSKGREVFQNVTDCNILVAIWFSIANVADLVFGLLCYAKYLDPLTAWVHHIIYIWIMIASTTGHGGFMTCEYFAATFSIMLLEELPTAILALGHVFPSLRSDWGFGSTFFVLRLCYHIYMASYAFLSGVETIVTVLFCLTTCMHAYWFYGWVTMMKKNERKRKRRPSQESSGSRGINDDKSK